MPLSLPVAVGVDVQYPGRLSRFATVPRTAFPRTDLYDDFRI